MGSDLRLVERVTGRLAKARPAGAGAISGARTMLGHSGLLPAQV